LTIVLGRSPVLAARPLVPGSTTARPPLKVAWPQITRKPQLASYITSSSTEPETTVLLSPRKV